MENRENEKKENESVDRIILNDDATFENESVDPGFEQSLDTGLNPQESRYSEQNSKPKEKLEDQNAESDNGPKDDALNYKNDRDHGAYNPKNI
ncbi:hypothetical protein DBR11_04890 [Pedobacter sp. HMWF019]|uniref:hypothetical protein n=1 Tax=Pedobacter sp. HMWF019 TaxID=2056856 RepID=UPI000D355957|nr:hypothetical protein [Pedobacter sp. HMWF019]PTT02362.1 hypothetical protein DBR11_04890 [Pedobacter sp. HMWF019]